jgi:hypothetical protein
MLVLDGQVNLAESDEIYTKQIVNSNDLGKWCFSFAGVSKLTTFVSCSSIGTMPDSSLCCDV